jgi:hypothetical protein
MEHPLLAPLADARTFAANPAGSASRNTVLTVPEMIERDNESDDQST